MTRDNDAKSAPNGWQAMKRGMIGLCPRCGKGKLFKSYLKQVGCCAVCGERFDHIRADDGPAWLTIVVVGHILAPMLLLLVPGSTWPVLTQMIFWPVLALALALLILPRAKGLFIALIWRTEKNTGEAAIVRLPKS